MFPRGGGIHLQTWGSIPEKEMENVFIASQFSYRIVEHLPVGATEEPSRS